MNQKSHLVIIMCGPYLSLVVELPLLPIVSLEVCPQMSTIVLVLDLGFAGRKGVLAILGMKS